MHRLIAGLIVAGIAVSGGIVLDSTPATAAGGPPIPPSWKDCVAFASTSGLDPFNEHFPCSVAEWDRYFDFTKARYAVGMPATPEPWEFSEFDDYWASIPGDMNDFLDERTKWMQEHERAVNEGRKPGTRTTVKPFTPSTSKPRAFMINVLGSVLKGATPEKWRREQLANEHRYNYSWDALNTEFGYSANTRGPDGELRPIPARGTGTYDDAVVDAYEQQATKGGKNGQPMVAAATKAGPVRKTVGALGEAALALTMMPVGFLFGNLATAVFGFDPDYGVCTQEPGVLRDVLANVAGADCNGWAMSAEANAAANNDVTPGFTSEWVCRARVPEQCFRVIGVGFSSKLSSGNIGVMGLEYTGGLVNTWSIQGRMAYDNLWRSLGVSESASGFNNITGACYDLFGPGRFCFSMQQPIGTHSDVLALRYGIAEDRIGGSTGMAVVAKDPDPARWLTCTIEGSDGHTYTAQSAAYRESSGRLAGAECPALPDGVRPTGVEIKGEGDGVPDQVMWQEDVTPEYAAWWDNYPECRTGACKLDLLIKPGDSSPAIASCFDAPDQCVNWFEDPDKEDTFQCRYGVHDVSLAECAVYSGVFKPERLTVGAPYSDPETGEWSGGQSSPSAANDLMNSPVQNPEVARECFASGWAAFNPVEWILTPIRCALEWAFVPRPAVVYLAGAELQNRFEHLAPGQLAAMIGDWSFTPNITGCSRTVNWTPTIGDQEPGTMVVWDFCDGSVMAPLGVIARTLTTCAFAVLVFVATKRAVAGMVDYR